jgi:hypothetical protein
VPLFPWPRSSCKLGGPSSRTRCQPWNIAESTVRPRAETRRSRSRTRILRVGRETGPAHQGFNPIKGDDGAPLRGHFKIGKGKLETPRVWERAALMLAADEEGRPTRRQRRGSRANALEVVNGSRHLHITWRESGIASLTIPNGIGFGTQLIAGALQNYTRAFDGMQCTFDLTRDLHSAVSPRTICVASAGLAQAWCCVRQVLQINHGAPVKPSSPWSHPRSLAKSGERGGRRGVRGLSPW